MLNIFILATGCYCEYLKYLYPTLKYLFPSLQKTIYLISDKDVKYEYNNIKYKYFHITDLPYPFINYNKVNYICDCIKEFNIDENDYFIYLDADSIILEMPNKYWDDLIYIINENKICFSLNPWGYIIDEHNEENKYSCTYLKHLENRNKFIQFSMFFGLIYKLFDLQQKMNYYINLDSQNKVISKLYDESVINKIIIDDNYECYLNNYMITYFKNLNENNQLDKLEETINVISYKDKKDIIFCVQKFNYYIKSCKKHNIIK